MSNNFQYKVEYDYDRITNCSESGCDSVCRCSSIENFRIEQVISWEIALEFATLDIIQNHAIERVISRFCTDDFDVEISGSYYGDEIDRVTLCGSSIDEINKVRDMLTTAEWIEYYLTLENGAVKQQHRGRVWEHAKIPIADIVPGRNRADLDKQQIGFYRGYIGNGSYQPFLLCEKKSKDKYQLIDGYHRYHAAMEVNVIDIDVIYYIGDRKKVAEFELGGAL